MGTSATLALGLYQQTLQRQGYSCIIPEPDEVERYCMGSIRAVKANRLTSPTSRPPNASPT